MRNYQIELVGKTPLLMHADDIEWSDFMDAWKNDPANKKISKAGDDRTPAWRFIGHCYHNGDTFAIPQANIMRSIMEGGAMVLVPGGKSGKTFKSQTQSGMMCGEPYWPLVTKDGVVIQWKDVQALTEVKDFGEIRKRVQALGFDLFIKRVIIGKSKHIRVRAILDAGWKINGTMRVWDEQITDQVLSDILEYAGQYKGLCDWRPGGKTPGPYGVYEPSVTIVG